MKTPYKFGLSQEDILTEIRGLDLKDGDSLLCIAGAGEVPLSVAALRHVGVVAVDSSESQLRLCRFKQLSATRLGPDLAAGFLGYGPDDENRRERLYKEEIAPFLVMDDRDFWKTYINVIRQGVIHAGKFEQFIAKASRPARWVIGNKNFTRLFGCSSIAEQEAVFDRYISGALLKLVFRSAFHPRIYKNRGIDEAGMQHRVVSNIGDFFFNRFRSFCCSTPARENFMLQYIFFRQSIFPEALPEYLKKENHAVFLQNSRRISFMQTTMETFLAGIKTGQFNKIQLSNISDWMPFSAMEQVFRYLQEKTTPGSRMVLRHIYSEPRIGNGAGFLAKDHQMGEELIKTDRFPFSSVVPIEHIIHPALILQNSPKIHVP